MKNIERNKALELRKNKNKDISSKIVIEKLISSNILDKFKNIGIYYPIGNEINIMDLVNIYPNKRFYLPITREEISFVEYKLNDKLVNGPFKTLEPVGDIVNRDLIECFIIPCVAISNENKRIGYGKGYYDRYLNGYKGYKIGVCYSESGDIDIKLDSYDVVLDCKILGW